MRLLRPRYLNILLGFLGVYALAILILAGVGEEQFEDMHLALDIGNGILSLLLAVFLLGERHSIEPRARNHLVIGFGFSAAAGWLHILNSFEWSGWFSGVNPYSATLLAASWIPASYVLPLALAWVYWLMRGKCRLSPARFAAGMTALTLGLMLLSLALPHVVEGGLPAVARVVQAPLLLLWAGVIAVYWRKRHQHPIFEGVALMGVLLLVSDLSLLYSIAPDDKFAMMAHFGKFFGYAMLHLIQMRIAEEDSEARSEAEAELRIAAVAFNLQVSMLITDAQGVILRVNQMFTQTTGYTADEVVGQLPHLLKSARHPAGFYRTMWAAIRRTGTWQGENWCRRKNGEMFPNLLNISAVRGDDGQVSHYIGAYLDITERKAAEEEIKQLAFYDTLTGLPNRRLLLDRLQKALISSARSGRRGALMFIDLDNFKTINDTLGHDAGDSLLKQAASRLLACVREDDTVARLGGDEFVVMLVELSKLELEAAAQTEVIGEKILGSLGQPYPLHNKECISTPSIGVAMCSGRHREMEELMKRADIAMYQAKESGRNALRFFEPEMQDAIDERATLEAELRRALDKRHFQLFYQIQVDSAHRLLGVEGLIRWMHPERGLMLPDQFIPLAEETGLILPIGQWILETASAQLRAWQDNVLTKDLVLAVNVSAKQFRQVDFAAQVLACVAQYDINPARLKLELTESLLFENTEALIATMNTLHASGVQFSLDDFGTGYSSLQYLKSLPLNQIKIDHSFVRDIAVNLSDRAIVRTIIAMAQSLSLDVIAEGVETEQQRQLLWDKGCTHFQGYLFSPPVPLEQFEVLLEEYI